MSLILLEDSLTDELVLHRPPSPGYSDCVHTLFQKSSETRQRGRTILDLFIFFVPWALGVMLNISSLGFSWPTVMGVNKNERRSSHRGLAETNLTRIHEVVGLILGLAQWVQDQALL